MLFSIYDVDGSGGIDYKEFSGVVFGRIASGVPKGSPGGGAAS